MSKISSPDLHLITLGVYGSTEESYFQALQDANVDTFVDVRRHRGLRGKRYRYANSTYLQEKLDEMGIRYVHLKSLSPTKEIRKKQKAADEAEGIRKRERSELGSVFVEAYEEEILDTFEMDAFLAALPDDAQVVALFCVERAPEACHRSLLAQRLTDHYNLSIEHIKP